MGKDNLNEKTKIVKNWLTTTFSRRSRGEWYRASDPVARGRRGWVVTRSKKNKISTSLVEWGKVLPFVQGGKVKRKKGVYNVSGKEGEII